MSKETENTGDHPFWMLGHGAWDPDERESAEVECYLWFGKPVPEGAREGIEEGAPAPLRSFFRWSSGGDVLHFGQDQNLDLAIKEAYGGAGASSEEEAPSDEDAALTEEEVRAFSGDVDAWLGRVHASHPLFLAIGVEGDPDDEWNAASVEAIPGAVLPRLHAAFSGARAPSEETRARGAEERMLSWVLFRALAAYLDTVDSSSVEEGTKALIGELVERSRGHSAEADDLNASYLRSLRR